MKRIGILTYHRSNNYGAFLQAYSLSKRLSDDFDDCKVEIIDYLDKEVYYLYHPSIVNLLKLILIAKPFRRKATYLAILLRTIKKHTKPLRVEDQSFEEARALLPLSNKSFVTRNINRVIEYINNEYDVLVVGSDAVWNWQTRLFPNPYFLGPNITTRKMSYAASSYGQPYKKITLHQKKFLNSAWSQYSYIGVRDKATEDFVKYVNAELCVNHNCDPTVILNIDSLPVNRESLKEKLASLGFDFKRKTIGIMAKPWLAKVVKKELGDEYQIVSVFNYNEEADINILNINPFEWACLFSFFDITITHYFHGNLLSLKNMTPTIVVEQPNDYNKQYNTKIRDFMSRIQLSEYCFFYNDIKSQGMLSERVMHVLANKDSYITAIQKGMASEESFFYSFEKALSLVIKGGA